MNETSAKALKERIGIVRNLIERDKSNKAKWTRQRDVMLKELNVVKEKIDIYNRSIEKKQDEILELQQGADDLQTARREQ